MSFLVYQKRNFRKNKNLQGGEIYDLSVVTAWVLADVKNLNTIKIFFGCPPGFVLHKLNSKIKLPQNPDY